MRILSLLILSVVSTVALAGGDYVLGKVTSFSGEGGNYSFHFIQTDGGKELMSRCREFDVQVNHVRVPWYSWLPFVQTSHPSKEKTNEAASFLLKAHQENRQVLFGYMGYGLVPSSAPCSFLSRGILLEAEKEKSFVLSFHNPI